MNSRMIFALILSRFFSGMAFQFLLTFGLYQLYASTASPLKVGLLGLALYLPSLLLTFSAGVAADRKKDIGRTYFVLQIAMLIATVFLSSGYKSDLLIYASSFCLAVFKTIRTPIFYSLVGEFKDRGLSTAVAVRWMTLSWQLPLVLGPLLFSLLSSQGSVIALAYTLSALSLLSVLCSWPLLSVTRRNVKADSDEAQCPQLFERDGIFAQVQAVIKEPGLAGPLFADMFVMALLGFSVLLPFVLADIQLPPGEIGLYRSLLNIGTVAVSLFAKQSWYAPGKRREFGILLLCVSLLTMSVSFTGSGLELAVLCVLIGGLDGLSILYRDSLILSFAQSHEIGRLSALNQILVSTTDDLGELRAGASAEIFGVRPAMIGGALIAATVSMIYLFKIDKIANRRYQYR